MFFLYLLVINERDLNPWILEFRCAGTVVEQSACVGYTIEHWLLSMKPLCNKLALVLKGMSCLTQCIFNSEPEVVCKCKRYRKCRTLEDDIIYQACICVYVYNCSILPSVISFLFKLLCLRVFFNWVRLIQWDGIFSLH